MHTGLFTCVRVTVTVVIRSSVETQQFNAKMTRLRMTAFQFDGGLYLLEPKSTDEELNQMEDETQWMESWWCSCITALLLIVEENCCCRVEPIYARFGKPPVAHGREQSQLCNYC